ncbi:GNAT family N-acetyltransferase [Amycolatopsis sp. H20-H5]|uniref:GNAT family N-acetyltransferase n=1 Tax=Amycolatopsis sp. H20-H5 TaxID=3046309 RepID=UPI002DBD8406|nr:N-acetyltransferase [Amycolatopsis sp. H20-H5]MEC3977780.1 N-acetyltransferase [Amycolatopsis sp. H20-H5]
MLIRRETSADHDAIRAVHTAAFPGPMEAKLVDELRTDGDLIDTLSLVAVIDGRVVGHLCCSPASIRSDRTVSVGLGPIGVLPEHHGAGVGSALMHAVVAAADALGYGVVILLGDPKFYSRFGFVLASTFSITPPEPDWARYFQVRTLAAYTPAVSGAFRYAPAFERL